MKDREKKTVGILGGMGPMATADFMARVISLTPARADQDHIRMLVDNNPLLPSRQLALLDDGPDPGPELAAMAVGLEQAGADFLVMPCNTAMAYAEVISDAVQIPLLSIIDLVVAECAYRKAVAVLATDGCLQSGLYQDALAHENKRLLLPGEQQQSELMRLISLIKTGDTDVEVADRMLRVARSAQELGADVIIAACTEVPLVLDETELDVPLVSSTDVLARATVNFARGD